VRLYTISKGAYPLLNINPGGTFRVDLTGYDKIFFEKVSKRKEKEVDTVKYSVN
jgi:hypothetical protein